MDSQYLSGQLLIAMPQLADPGFHHTVTYITDHDEQGAMGLTINRQTDLTLGEILLDMDISPSGINCDLHPVLSGGPVQPETGFILHPPTEQQWHSSRELQKGLWLTTSRDVLEAIAADQGPTHSLIILGYAGWVPDQLEQELTDNTWLSTPATLDLVFEVPFAQRWQAAARQLGVNIHTISTQSGHG